MHGTSERHQRVLKEVSEANRRRHGRLAIVLHGSAGTDLWLHGADASVFVA